MWASSDGQPAQPIHYLSRKKQTACVRAWRRVSVFECLPSQAEVAANHRCNLFKGEIDRIIVFLFYFVK